MAASHIAVRQTLMLALVLSVLLIVLGQVSPADLMPLRLGLEGLHRINATVIAFIDGRQDLLTVCGFLLLLSTTFLTMVAALVEHYANSAQRPELGENAEQEHAPDHPGS